MSTSKKSSKNDEMKISSGSDEYTRIIYNDLV